MRTLIIIVAVFSAFISGCATSASNTWVCADGTCLPKYAMTESNDQMTSSQNQQIALAKVFKGQ